MKTGSYKFAANISSVDAKKRQMTLTVYGYDAYRAEDVDALDVGSVFSTNLDGAVEAQNVTVEKIERMKRTAPSPSTAASKRAA